jgi:hypothetical protein
MKADDMRNIDEHNITEAVIRAWSRTSRRRTGRCATPSCSTGLSTER